MRYKHSQFPSTLVTNISANKLKIQSYHIKAFFSDTEKRKNELLDEYSKTDS